MPQAKKQFLKPVTGKERMEAVTKLLAMGIVRLASREQGAKERETTGLKAPSKRSSKSTQLVDIKGKRRG